MFSQFFKWWAALCMIFYPRPTSQNVQQRSFEEILQKQERVCLDNTVGHHKAASAAMCGALLLTDQESVIFTFDKKELICRTYRENDFIGCLFQACTSCRSYKFGDSEQPSKSIDEPCTVDLLGVRYPHPTDCTKYVECVHGGLLERDCNTGTYFDAHTNMCDYPQNTNCQY